MNERDKRSGRSESYSLDKAREVLDRRELMKLGAAGLGAAVVGTAGLAGAATDSGEAAAPGVGLPAGRSDSGRIELQAPNLGRAPQYPLAAEPIEIAVQGAAPAACRVILLLLTPRRVATLRDQIIPAITRVLRDRRLEDQLTGATRPEQAFALTNLMSVELQEHLLVEDALISLNYRVYPDTPLPEIIDLMVRREVRAVPVVGENYEVLGIITAGDAIKHLLPRFRLGEVEGTVADAAEEPTARDVMSRTIMCVSEDQSLLEAANILVNRDLEQIPVVREGELVGFVNREVILRLLSHPESSMPE